MNIHVVLDSSALAAYARLDSVAVGELITVVSENGGTVGVPAPVFADAYRVVDSDERKRLTRLLTDDVYTLILPMLADDLREVAELSLRLPLPLAHAVTQTRRHGASLATFDPGAVQGDLDDYDVLNLN
ncbi:PIN domain-containing protein [Catellatospora sp. NPDC049111]|uniref:PIN domain-containing protein n=1 Tax=Catellatospora sp. NPDC049111 TaxID=3155271 RepID=UPI0034069360